MLACMLERDRVVVAGHLDKDAAAQMPDQVLVVSEISDGTNRLRSEPEVDAHRTGWERIDNESPRDFDGCHHARSIVIGLIGMTDMRHDEHFARRGIGSA